MTHPWYVLRCATQQELTIETEIRKLGFSAMAPYREVWHRVRAGRPRMWRYALFPGYAFVALPDAAVGWQAIHGALNTDIRRIVYGFLPGTVRPEDVGYLMSIADGRYQPEDDAPRPLRVGDRVVIPAGPLQGFTGTILRLIRGKKATVMIKQVKIVRNVEINVANLDRV